MSRVLVTGASGLLGRRVCRLLADSGTDVVGTSRSGASGTRVVDLARPGAAEDLLASVRPDVVLHLAGGQSGGLWTTNVVPTVHLLDAVAQAAPRARLIVAGSAAEYGDGAGVPLAETALCAPVNDYGRAKLAQTSLARELARRDDLQLLVVRPFNVVAHDMPVGTALGNVLQQVLAGSGPVRHVRCGRTDVLRDFATADDVAAALARLIALESPEHVLNICTGTGTALLDVIEGLAAALEVSVELTTDPRLAALPAPSVVVGDAGRLEALGVRLDGTAPRLVDALLHNPPKV